MTPEQLRCRANLVTRLSREQERRAGFSDHEEAVSLAEIGNLLRDLAESIEDRTKLAEYFFTCPACGRDLHEAERWTTPPSSNSEA